jgi:hypothetical protein
MERSMLSETEYYEALAAMVPLVKDGVPVRGTSDGDKFFELSRMCTRFERAHYPVIARGIDDATPRIVRWESRIVERRA